MHHSLVFLPLAALFATSSLAAQTFVVDSANGPGTHYTDLFTAVAAVPNGATLHVRPGSYNAFNVSKSLMIIGHRSASGAFPSVNGHALAPGILIGSLTAGQSVTISGLQLGTFTVPSAQLSVTNCAGRVVLEDITCSFQVPFTLRVTGSPNVHASRVTVSAFLPTTATPPNAPVVVQNSSVSFSRLNVQGYRRATGSGAGTAGIEIRQQSRVVLVDSSVSGGAALAPSTNGGPGAFVEGGCTLHAYGNAGVGPGGLGGGLAVSGTGGDGLVLQGGSFARVRGAVLTGGSGTTPGQPFVRDAGSTLDYVQNDVTPSAVSQGTVAPNQAIHYTLHARPGAGAALLVGVAAQFVQPAFLTLGAFEVEPIVWLGAGTVPASGTLDVVSTVPATWPNDAVLLAQYLTFHGTTNEWQVSNLFSVTSRY